MRSEHRARGHAWQAPQLPRQAPGGRGRARHPAAAGLPTTSSCAAAAAHVRSRKVHLEELWVRMRHLLGPHVGLPQETRHGRCRRRRCPLLPLAGPAAAGRCGFRPSGLRAAAGLVSTLAGGVLRGVAHTVQRQARRSGWQQRRRRRGAGRGSLASRPSHDGKPMGMPKGPGGGAGGSRRRGGSERQPDGFPARCVPGIVLATCCNSAGLRQAGPKHSAHLAIRSDGWATGQAFH